jgi:hypothetical protein
MVFQWIDVQAAPAAERPPGVLLFADGENDAASENVKRKCDLGYMPVPRLAMEKTAADDALSGDPSSA